MGSDLWEKTNATAAAAAADLSQRTQSHRFMTLSLFKNGRRRRMFARICPCKHTSGCLPAASGVGSCCYTRLSMCQCGFAQ